MPNPVWPVSLPTQWGIDAQRARESNNVLRTAMDAGPAKMRRRATADFIATPFTLVLSTAQKDTLETFYVTTLLKVNVFDWNDFSTAGNPVRTFRFTAPPVYRYAGPSLWYAQFALEQMP